MNAQNLFDDFIALIKEQVKNGQLPEFLNEIVLTKETHLDELGLDSISLVSLLTCLMDLTESYIPETLFSDNPTLWEIAQRAVKDD